MGFHATIGNSNKRAPRVRASDRRIATQTQYGTDVNLPGDRRGAMGASLPMTAIYSVTSAAYGVQFASKLARSIVVQGPWRQVDGGYTIRTQAGLLKLIRGTVILNAEHLGYCGNIISQTARDEIITHVIAGTLPQVPVRSEKSGSRSKVAKAYMGGEISNFVIYAVGPKGKIRYTVPEDKTSGEVVDDMVLKGYEIIRIANH